MTAYILMVALPYLLFLVFLVFKLTGHEISREVEIKMHLILFFSLFFVTLALRHKSIGVDMQNYLTKYHRIALYDISYVWDNSGSIDIGYGLLNKFFAQLGFDDRIFIAAISFMMVAPIAWLYCRESDNWMLTVSLFLILPIFTMCFSGFRQALAIAVVPFAFYFAQKRKLIGFIITVLLAMSFHNSAVFLAFLYPVFHMRLTKRSLYFIVPSLILAFILNRQIYALVLGILGGKYEERYSDMSGTGAYTMLILFILLAVFSFVFTDESKMDKYDFGLRNILLLIVVLQFFAPVNSIAMRVNYYYLLFLPIIIPRMVVCHNDRYKNFVYIAQYGMVALFTFYFFYKLSHGSDTMRIYPYLPYWSGI